MNWVLTTCLVQWLSCVSKNNEKITMVIPLQQVSLLVGSKNGQRAKLLIYSGCRALISKKTIFPRTREGKHVNFQRIYTGLDAAARRGQHLGEHQRHTARGKRPTQHTAMHCNTLYTYVYIYIPQIKWMAMRGKKCKSIWHKLWPSVLCVQSSFNPKP